MATCDSRLTPLSLRRALLLLVPLALLGAAFIGLLAPTASADHTVVASPTFTSTPGPAGTSTTPTWTFSVADGHTTTCTFTGPGVSQTVESCGTSFTPSAPLTTDGAYLLSVTAAEPTTYDSDSPTVVLHNGGTSAPAESTYTLDRAAPGVTVTGPTGAAYTGWDVAVTDDTATTSTCTLNSSTGSTLLSSSTCNTNPVEPALVDGETYTLSVTATDAAGNTTTATSAPFTYDGSAPTVTFTSEPTGPSADTTPTWTYSVVDGGAPSCTLTGPGTTTTTVACGADSYTASLTVSGEYTLTVTSTDGAGNTARVTSVPYVLDVTGPGITINPGTSSTGTADAVTWTVTITDATEGSCTVVGATSSTATCSASGGTVDATLAGDGTVTLTVSAKDGYGNTSTASVSYTRDTTAPAGPTLTQEHAGSTGSAATLAWTWTPADGHTTQCRLTVDATVGAWEACDSRFETPTSTQGTYTLEVRHVDSLLNVGVPSSASYVYDSIAPTAPGVALVGPDPRQPGDATWTVTPTADDVTGTECRVIGPGVDAATVAWATCDLTIVRTLTAEGTHVVEVRQHDDAGNVSAVASSSVTVDGTAPTAPTVTGGPSTSTSTTLEWTLTHTSADGTSFRCRLLHDGTGPAELTACVSNYSVTVTADGTYTLEVVSVDDAGNLSPVTTSAPHTVDTTGPAAPEVTLAVTSGNTTSATWGVTPSETGTTSQCRLTRTADGLTTVVLDWTACSTYTFDLLSGDGVYVLQVRTLDALGNVGEATTGPGYTLDATPPDAPTVVGSRTGTDNEREITYSFTGEGTATCSLYRGTTLVQTWAGCHTPQPFAVTLPDEDGSYTLHVTFTDSFGNTGAAGVSDPYVLDVTPPDAPTVTGSRTGTDNEREITYSFTGEGTAVCRLYRDGVLVDTWTDCHTATPSLAVTLPDVSGTYVLTVTYTDAYGNEGAPGSSAPYVLDVTPPGAATVTVTPRTDNVESATWTVTPPEPGTTSECRLLKGTVVVWDWRPCAAPYTYSLPEGDGVYVLEVRLTDAVGNLGAVTTGESYTLDMTPPDVPTVTSDRTVKDNERTVTYTFSGEGTATCTLMRGSDVVQGPQTCTSTYTVLLPDVSGTYHLLVTYTDAVGNTSDAGRSPDYELDVTPPTQPVVTSDRSGTDNERVVTYEFSGEGTATCTLMRGTTVVVAAQTCTSPWVVTLPTTDGSYHLLVTYTDAVGNTSTAGASPKYLLDLTPPPAPVVSGPPATGNSTTVSWTYSGEGTATCTLLLDGVATSGPFACGATGYTTTLPSDGAWSLQVTFTDAVGNTGPPGTSSTYLLDTAAPPAPGVAGPSGPSQKRSPSWTVSAETGTTLECRLLRGGTVVLDWTPCSGSYTADLTGLPDGSYVVEARATDKAGNLSGTGTSGPYVLDTTAPAAAVVSGPSGPSQLRTPRFTWIAEAGATAECQLSRDGSLVGGWVACTSGFSPSLTGDGTWTVTVRLTDAAGNVSAPATSGGYVLDTTAPAAPIVTPPQSPGRDLTPSWGANVEGGASLECRLIAADGTAGAWAACTLPHATPLEGLPDGRYVLEIRATDAAGNLSAVGSGAYVLDTAAPAAAVVVAPSSPGRSTTPTFTFTTEAGATTTCRLTSGTTLISDFVPCTSPASLDLTGLPDGTYTLTVRVTDAAGNPGPAATGTYVLDTTGPAAPVLTLSPASPSSTRSITWAFTYEAGGTLVCRLTSPTGAVRDLVACTSPLTVDLTGLPDGTYTLTVHAVDAAGNVGKALTVTHVLDSTALAGPSVTGPVSPGSTRTPTWTIGSGTTECRLTRGTTVLRDWSACTGSFTADLFGRPDGTYTLHVRSKSATGAVSAATLSHYVLDTTAPAAAALVAPPTPSTNRMPTWSIASPEVGATAQCRVLVFGSVLDDWAPCAVSAGGSLHTVDLTGLGDGTYTLVVRVTDAAGNRGPETSSAYVLDTRAPVAVGVTGPASPGNDTSPTWQLSTGGSASLECRLTSAEGVVSDWAPCEGSYTADLQDLPDGTYTLSVRAVSEAGTPGPETTSAYVLNTAAPGVPTALALSGVTSPGNSRTPTWTFTLPQGTTGHCTVVQGTRVVYDGPCSSPFSLDLSNAADGSYTLTVQAVDTAGNLSTGVSSTYVLDTVPTSPPVFTQVPGALGSTLDPQWRFSVVHGATAQCRLLYEGVALGGWVACTSPYTATLTGRPDGRYTLEVRAVDGAGNASAPIANSYLLDRTALPVTSFTSTPPTPGTDPTVSWTFTAPAGTTLECRLTGPDGTTAWGSCTAGTYRLDLSGRPDGDYSLEVRVVDADGRRGSAARATYTLDTTAPAAPEFTDTPPTAGSAPDPTWHWDGSTDDLIECRLVRVGGSAVTAWGECGSPQTTDLSRLGDGTYALEIRVVDAAGNVSAVTSAAYRYDTTSPNAPVFTSRPPASGSDRTVSWTFLVPVDATATCTVTRGRILVRQGPCSGRYDLNLSGLPDGVYTLTVRFTDSAGNVSLPTSGSYTLSTLRVGGPVRVDPPPQAPTAPGGSGPGPVSGPGRGGTGIVVPQNSTSRPGVPTMPLDDDVVRGSGNRPSASLPTSSTQEVAPAAQPDNGSTHPLLPGRLPVEDVPEVLRDVVTGTITRPTLPLALLAIVVLFLLAQNRIDRRDPKLASAPVEAEPELDFTAVIRRPGGAYS